MDKMMNCEYVVPLFQEMDPTHKEGTHVVEFDNQPAPVKNNNLPVWELVKEDMTKRNIFGMAKYGVPLQAFNGRDVLQDAYEEALDLCVYLRQAIEERNNA